MIEAWSIMRIDVWWYVRWRLRKALFALASVSQKMLRIDKLLLSRSLVLFTRSMRLPRRLNNGVIVIRCLL